MHMHIGWQSRFDGFGVTNPGTLENSGISRHFEAMNELTLSVVEEYDRDRDLYLDYAATLHTLVRDLLAASNFKPHSVRHRLKDRTSLARKVLSDMKYSSLVELTDAIGIRVITYFADEVDVVASIIRREFKVESESDKRAEHLPGEFGYRSLHQVVRLNSVRSELLDLRYSQRRFRFARSWIMRGQRSSTTGPIRAALLYRRVSKDNSRSLQHSCETRTGSLRM